MNWTNRTLLIGGAAGLLLGLAGAYIFIERAKDLEIKPEITPGDGVKLGLGVLGVLRLISDVAEKG